jgi:NAD(P)H-dependent flavin oxidoreductase YrpB (nitropropane dioxygenase family)
MTWFLKLPGRRSEARAEEARRAVASGVDEIVAQGCEAGGIDDARGVAAVLALGAQAA